MNGVDFQIEIVQDGIAGFSGVQVRGERIGWVEDFFENREKGF